MYCDIEMEFSREQKDDIHQLILEQTMAILTKQLGLLTKTPTDVRLNDYVMIINHRFKPGHNERLMWTLSAHVVFPSVMFETNTTGMKAFIQNVDQILRQNPDLIWTKIQKIGNEARTSIDQRTYSHEQPFRVMFTSKEGNAHAIFKPYDVKSGNLIEVTDENAAILFDRSLISLADTKNCITITDDQVAQFCAQFCTPKTGHKIQKAAPIKAHVAVCDPGLKTPPPASTGVENQEDRRILEQVILPNLLPQRWTDTHTWLHLGYGLAKVYSGDPSGLALFLQYSATAPNYDEQECRKVYRKSNGKIGIGSFFKWFSEDDPIAYNEYQQRQNRRHTEDRVEKISAEAVANENDIMCEEKWDFDALSDVRELDLSSSRDAIELAC